MKKLVLIAAAILMMAVPTFADGLSIVAEIPVENSGKAGVYVLEQDGEIIQELPLSERETGCFTVDLHALDRFEYVVRQSVPRGPAETEYDMSVYKVTVTTLLSAEGEPTSFFSVQKDGEDGKAERILFFNRLIEQDVPRTGDAGDLAVYIMIAAGSLAMGSLTAVSSLKKRRG